MDNKLFSTILVLICTAILLGCNNLAEPELITDKVTDTIKDTDTINNQNLCGFEKSPIDQVININFLIYDIYPKSFGIDWNLKSKVPYPCDSIFNARGIYYDEEFECWRLSEQARKEQERIQKVSTPINKSAVLVSKEDKITQIDEEAPVIEKPKVTQPKQNTSDEQPQLLDNYKALFKGSNTSQAGGSEGITSHPGDQGKPNGLAGIKQYEGNGGKGNGPGYSLGGRGAKSLHRPSDDFTEEGTIVVDIWVNREGKVVRAEVATKGTTLINQAMREKAKQAALLSSFASDPDAPEEQHGTITYNFVINQ
jgi:hypothetical protein